jgi:hypothetical protein
MSATNSTSQFNKLFIIESLAETELHTGERLYQEAKPILSNDVSLTKVTNRLGFVDAMARVWGECARRTPRVYPMLHVDSHGAEDINGILLLPTREVVVWDDFAGMCREVNVECHNNLIVTMGLCYGLHAIKPTKMTEAVPFLALIGPEDKVPTKDVDCFASFYMALLRGGDINSALEHMFTMAGTRNFTTFFAEKLLLEGFAAYIREDCRGKGRLERVERLLTEYNATRRSGRKLSLRDARRIIKERTRPDAAAFERFRRRFLMSNHPLNAGRFTSTFDDAMALVARAP